MKSHWANALFGVFDYLAYPFGMLLLAPVIVHALGVERYGVWAIASATLSTGAIIASGFGDANIRFIANAIGGKRRSELLDSVSNTLGIHIVLGIAVAALQWVVAPVLMRSIVKVPGDLGTDCIWSLRITAVLMIVRALETVCVSTQRAFSRYGAAIQVSVVARLLSLVAASVTPHFVRTVWAIMISTLIINGVALSIQIRQLKSLLGISRLVPRFNLESARPLLHFGSNTWFQSVAGLLFGQIDRIIAGVMFGAAAVTSYAFCVQLAQPIYGISAAGLHFLFPHLASRMSGKSVTGVRGSVIGAFAANLAFVAVALVIVLRFGTVILRVWVGPVIAAGSAALLPPIAVSSAIPALGVTGCYALLAMDRPRTVTALNVIGGVVMMMAIPLLASHFGLAGIAYGRLFFGPIVMLVYVPVFFMLTRGTIRTENVTELPITTEV